MILRRKPDGPLYVYQAHNGRLRGVWVIRYRGYILLGDYGSHVAAKAEYLSVRAQGTRKPKGNRAS